MQTIKGLPVLAIFFLVSFFLDSYLTIKYYKTTQSGERLNHKCPQPVQPVNWNLKPTKASADLKKEDLQVLPTRANQTCLVTQACLFQALR